MGYAVRLRPMASDGAKNDERAGRVAAELKDRRSPRWLRPPRAHAARAAGEARLRRLPPRQGALDAALDRPGSPRIALGAMSQRRSSRATSGGSPRGCRGGRCSSRCRAAASSSPPRSLVRRTPAHRARRPLGRRRPLFQTPRRRSHLARPPSIRRPGPRETFRLLLRAAPEQARATLPIPTRQAPSQQRRRTSRSRRRRRVEARRRPRPALRRRSRRHLRPRLPPPRLRQRAPQQAST